MEEKKQKWNYKVSNNSSDTSYTFDIEVLTDYISAETICKIYY